MLIQNSTESYEEQPTTTTRTTTTSTTLAPFTTKPFYRDWFQHHTTDSPFKFNFYTPSTTTDVTPIDLDKYFETSSTTQTSTKHSTTSSERPTINPFYYGFNYFKNQKSTPTSTIGTSTSAPITTTTISYPTTAARAPFAFQPYSFSTYAPSITTSKRPHNIVNINYSRYFTPSTPGPEIDPPNSATIRPSIASSTIAPYFSPLTTTTTTPPQHTTKNWLSNKNSTTISSAYDIYLKRLASTTKNPYNFENFHQYFKTSTSNPKFSYNLFGANSNNFALNSTATQ